MKVQDEALVRLGGRIRALREVRGLKLKQLADATGLSDAFVSRLERGQVSSSVANLIQIAQALDIGVSELFADPPDRLRSDVTVHRHGDGGLTSGRCSASDPGCGWPKLSLKPRCSRLHCSGAGNSYWAATNAATASAVAVA